MTHQNPWTSELPPACDSIVDLIPLPGSQDSEPRSYSGSASSRSSPRDSHRPNLNHAPNHQMAPVISPFRPITNPGNSDIRMRGLLCSTTINHSKSLKAWSFKRRAFFVVIICAFIFLPLYLYESLRRRREEERLRLNSYWDELTPAAHCASYGAREYTARLQNVPVFNRVKACKTTPIVIHDRTIKTPDKCEDRGIWGGMHGFWLVRYNEMACLPIWGDFVDKGCTAEGSRLQRIESRLWNIQSGEDWKQMCATTPADIHGKYFDSPKNCDDRGIWGIFGVWELEDPNC